MLGFASSSARPGREARVVKHAELQRFGAIVLHFYLAWSGLETLKLEILSFLLLGGMSKGDQRQNTARDVLSS
jgi:hypothetical protein